MTAFNPSERPTITEIAQHPWVNNSVCSQNEIKQEFTARLQKLDEVLEQRRQEQEAQKAQHMQSANMGMNRGEL